MRLPGDALVLECVVDEERLRVGDEIVVDLDGRKTACRIEAFEAGFCQGAFGELVCGEQALVRVSIL
jgi:hypothetical protein